MECKQKTALTFGLYQNDQLIRRETVTQDIVKVGKDAKSHLRVEDELASRMHAVIEVASPDAITLIDLGSAAGTMVNGARVNKCKVGVGDQIQIGGTRIVLERAEAVAVAAAAGPSQPPMSQPPAAAAAAAFGGGANPFGAPAGGDSPFGEANPFGQAPASSPFGAAVSPFGEAFGGASPFAPAPVDDVPPDAPEGSYTYQMIKGGAPVPSEEVESAATAVEVMVLWDQSVLHVSHLSPPRPFYVGEEQGRNVGCDYFVPAEKLGTTRAPIVLALPGRSRSTVRRSRFRMWSRLGARSPARSCRGRTRWRYPRVPRPGSSWTTG